VGQPKCTWIIRLYQFAYAVHGELRTVDLPKRLQCVPGRRHRFETPPTSAPAEHAVLANLYVSDFAGRPMGAFIYNEFFWPLRFIQSGSRLPITTGIKNLQGQFFSDYNLIAAGATFTIIPTLIIYLLLQRHFVAGLTLGASKG
jgi:hypothetical protein